MHTTARTRSVHLTANRLAASAGTFLLALGIVAFGTGPAANAATPEVTAEPASIAVGGTSAITATGLGGLESAAFGLDGTPGGSFTESGSASYDAPASGGTATATFTATEPGTFTVAVGDGETPLATVTVTVTAGTPTPTASPTQTATPTPTSTPTRSATPTASPSPTPANDGGVAAWVPWLIVGIVIVAAAIVVWVVLARRRGGSDSTP